MKDLLHHNGFASLMLESFENAPDFLAPMDQLSHAARHLEAAVARVVDGEEKFETFGEALGIVGFVGISRHPEILKTQDTEHASVRLLAVALSLMEGPWVLAKPS